MSASRHPGFPARPILRPGVRVCRREDGWIQVGLAERLALVAKDTAEIHGLLDNLRNGVAPPPPGTVSQDVRRLCADLLDHELVLDADELLVALGRVRGSERRETLSAFFCDHVTDAAALLDQRDSVAVGVSHRSLPRAARRLRGLLEEAGVNLSDRPQLIVHLSRGEPDRDDFDAWMRDDLPHVLLICSEGTVRAGPFVVPGRTACLRCVDAHHTDRDPRRSLVIAQYAAAHTPRDGLPEPVPHDLLEMAVLWLARDIVNWIDGALPRTWSASVDFDAGLNLARTKWPQHPACGCSWGSALAI